MQDVNGVLTCIAGKMPLARMVQDYLVQHFPAQVPRSADVRVGVELTRWFCPGCGVPLQDMVCPRCGGSLRSMHHSLVERHYHEGETEAYQRWKAQQDGAGNSHCAGQCMSIREHNTVVAVASAAASGCA